MKSIQRVKKEGDCVTCRHLSNKFKKSLSRDIFKLLLTDEDFRKNIYTRQKNIICSNLLRTVPTNSKVFLPRFMIMQGKVDLPKCY